MVRARRPRVSFRTTARRSCWAPAEPTQQGGKALALTTDVTQREQLSNLVNTAVQQFGRIDLLINNAGLMPQSLLERLRVEEWDRMIDVNIKGVLYGIAAALPHMQRQKAGHLINVSSVAGQKVGPGRAVYSATKHAVRLISEGPRQELKPYNLRTTVISPGAVATELPDTIADQDGCAASENCTPRWRSPPIPLLEWWSLRWPNWRRWT